MHLQPILLLKTWNIRVVRKYFDEKAFLRFCFQNDAAFCEMLWKWHSLFRRVAGTMFVKQMIIWF